MKAKGYSLWFMPAGNLRYKLIDLIGSLAHKYSGPVFEPHITLLGSIEMSDEIILEKLRYLAKNASPFTINLASIGFQETFFRALFIRAELNQQLMELHARAQELFNTPRLGSYMPHLSVYYGEISQEIKESLAIELNTFQSQQLEVSKIYLYKTTGEAEEWNKVTEVRLGAL